MSAQRLTYRHQGLAARNTISRRAGAALAAAALLGGLAVQTHSAPPARAETATTAVSQVARPSAMAQADRARTLARARAIRAAERSAETTFTAKINNARAARGVRRLTERAALVEVARSWAATMARQSVLRHNPELGEDVNRWRRVGENVGYGLDATTMHVALMRSPGHRANILNLDYTEVGVGAVRRNGRVWVAQVFRTPRG